MTTKLTKNERQVIFDYLTYWMNEYNLDQLDVLRCTDMFNHLEKKFTKELMLKNPRLLTNLTNMIVVRYILDKEDDSEEED